MKKDIKFPTVKDVIITVANEGDEWKVFLVNRRKDALENVLVTSKGYGDKNGKQQETGVLRHVIPSLSPGEYALIEPISEEVFHLTNEYWLSFYIKGQVFDKKYLFVPDTLQRSNLSFIPEIGLNGVLHE